MLRFAVIASRRCALLAALVLCAQRASSAGLSQVTFAEATPLSGNAELARRMLSPLTSLKLRQTLAHSGKVLADQPIDLAQESFALYVPSVPPPSGYGLLVFVPPWDDARLPDGWAPVLDRFGLIFVSAARSGNSANDLARREPLALAAEENVRKQQHVDPARIYVAGFSGGSRVAMHLALAYPDVFRGAVLDAGGDPIGTPQVPLPPRDLLHQFQVSSRLVYVAGDEDGPGQRSNRISRESMRHWCMFDDETQAIPSSGMR